MKNLKLFGSIALVLALFGIYGKVGSADLGKDAPAFTAMDSDGKQRKLSDFKGKFVVLEWHNQGCPFVKAHYSKGKMQALQAKWTAKDIVWLRVISSAPGKEGYLTAPEALEAAKKQGAKATATLLDPEGTVGKAYGARTTPHMFIISPKGKLIYAGAIDNAPLTAEAVEKNEDGAVYINYIDQALTEATAKKKISIPSTTAYGCGVKV